MNAYCHADAAEQASWFGDDIAFKGEGFEVLDMSTAQAIAFFVRRVGSFGTPAERARRVAELAVTFPRRLDEFLTTHSTLGSQFVGQIGLGEPVQTAVRQAYEQWDGKGRPQHLRGEQICLPSRLVQVASPAEVFSRRHGVQSARRVVRKQAGGQLDAAARRPLLRARRRAPRRARRCRGLGRRPGRRAARWAGGSSGAELDRVLEAMADLVDLKSPYLAGHSRGVANLAAAAARGLGLDAAEVSHRAPGGPAARPGPARRAQHGLGPPRPAARGGRRAGPPAPVPHRPDARARVRAAGAAARSRPGTTSGSTAPATRADSPPRP